MTPHDLHEALRSGETIAQLSQEKGVSVDSLVTEVTAIRSVQLQKEVSAGKLTQEQANQILSNLQNGFTYWFNNGKPPEDWHDRAIADDHIEQLASQLGITPGQLQDDMKSGETIAQLAQEKGISVDNLVTNLTTKRIAQIQQEVTDGKLTQDQANLILANLQKGYTAWFTNGKPPDGWSDRTVADEHLEVLANQLGITPGQLKDDLKSSDTLEQLAQEKGVSVNTLVTEITANRAAELQPEIDFALARAADCARITGLIAAGTIPERVTHNDTKLNNVLLDDVTAEGVCVIDLDTTMPGSALYDFGDMVRTAVPSTREDNPDLGKLDVRLDRFESLVGGYLDSARSFLNQAEVDHLPFAGILLTLECGIRFLTDYLQGDVYFKIKHPAHNLDRCRNQFAFVAVLEGKLSAMETIVKSHC